MTFWPTCAVGCIIVLMGFLFVPGSTGGLVCTFLGLGIQVGALLRGLD